MGRVYRRTKSGPFWGDFQDPHGKRIRLALHTKDRAVARERLRQAELAATPQARGRRQRLSQAIDHVISLMHDKAEGTREMYRQKGRRIAETLGDPYVHEIDRDMLSGYIARRLNKEDSVHGQASPHTVQKELITIRRALREANERGVLAAMPSMPRHSPRYQPREVWLEPAEFEILVGELAPHRRMWASLAALAGGSAGEVERVEWEAHVDLRNGMMVLPGTKRETRHRKVPIAPALLARLLEVPERERTGKVAPVWGSVRRDLHAAIARANKKLAARAAELGQVAKLLPKVSPNDLRRTFGSWLVQRGVPTLTVATLMGHSSTRMVERVYGRLSKTNLEEAIGALPRLKGATDATDTVRQGAGDSNQRPTDSDGVDDSNPDEEP